MVMLLSNYKDHKEKIKFPVICQYKYDGNRSIFDKNKKQLLSKSGKVIHNCSHITNILKDSEYSLDGELYSFNLDFNELNGMCRLKESVYNAKKTNQHLVFIIFDIISSDPYHKRLDILKNYLSQKTSKSIILIDTKILHNNSEIENELINASKTVEGIVLKNGDHIYTHSRSNDVLKYKLRDDSEFEIIDINPSQLGKCIFTLVTNCKKYTFTSVAHFVKYHPDLIKLYKNKYMTVSYQELDEFGTPRFPICKSIK
jgi:ATP-dependent DNA ligase